MLGIEYKTGFNGRGKAGNESLVISNKDNAIVYTNNAKEVKELCLKQIKICSIKYDYSDDAKNSKEKLERLSALQELREIFKDHENIESLMSHVITEVFEMITNNIFRPLPMEKKSANKFEPFEVGIEFSDNVIDTAWPHLEPVYCLILEIAECNDIRLCTLMPYFSNAFFQNFILLFDSEEPRERRYLKNILHAIYARLVPKRRKIKKIISDYLSTMIHENQSLNGASELLSILEKIATGFVVPLRQDHIIFFKDILVPLHKLQNSHLFQEELFKCSMLYINRDNSLAIPLAESLLRYWPVGNSVKETLFLAELNDIIELCDISKLEPLIPKIFKRFIHCISSSHFSVLDSAMHLFKGDYFVRILHEFKKAAFLIIVPAIMRLAENQCSEINRNNLNDLKTIFKEIDQAAFDRAVQEQNNSSKINSFNAIHNLPKRVDIESKWELLIKRAQAIDPSLILPKLPYVDYHLVGLHNMNSIELHPGNLIQRV